MTTATATINGRTVTLDEALSRLRDLERLHLLAQRWARLHRLSHPSATMDSPAPVTSMDQLAQRVATRADCLAARRELLEHLESMESRT